MVSQNENRKRISSIWPGLGLDVITEWTEVINEVSIDYIEPSKSQENYARK